MIPVIGTMVGAYIITRMVSLMTRTGDREEHEVVFYLAAFTAIVAGIGIFLLWVGARDVSEILGPFGQ